MKGVVFNLLEAAVRRDYSDDTWEELLETTDIDGAYTSLGNYPDEEMMKLVGAASSVLKIPADDVVRWFGRNALPLLAKKHPYFFDAHKSTRPFLYCLRCRQPRRPTTDKAEYRQHLARVYDKLEEEARSIR